MARKSTAGTSKRVEAFTHEDSRLNIPTEELSAFVQQDEETPATMLYPRDPSLDPQLVWKGKDEQDREDLAVPVVPIYIQEKIHPQAIIADIQSRSSSGGVGEAAAIYDQIDFFGQFNGISDFEDRIDFYQHPQHWSNRMILGDSLYVMTSLAEKEGLKGKVQTIYFDPPYGIKFGSNWQVSTRKRDVKDGSASDATRQPEQVRAFRDTWKLGVHSYLAYLRDRLTVARDLLTESGSIFVQIGDENLHLVKSVLDEVFGSTNSVAVIPFNKTSGAGSPAIGTNTLASVCDFLVWYAKDIDQVKYRQLYEEKDSGFDPGGKYSYVQNAEGARRRARDADYSDGSSRFFRLDNLTSQASPPVPFIFEDKAYVGGWKTNETGLNRLVDAGRIASSANSLNYIRFIDDFPAVPINNMWTDIGGIQSRVDPKVYVVQTNPKALQRCILMTTDPGDLMLDPTCGSGTTAYVAEQWGRRWITIDTSRVALALARTRLMAGRFPYYLLADSEAGLKKEAELSGKMAPSYATAGDVRKGFVYKRVPHVTLKSIANNPDIKEGMTRTEIDAAIARHADSETLYDQPYEEPKVVRVTGPFTVESLSPHRVLSTADDDWDGTVSEQEAQEQQDFATLILENLRKYGVQTVYKNERLEFTQLEPFPNKWIAATGEFVDASGERKRVAVSIGPEHGTVGKDQVREAAKEAVKGIGFDVLVVCGFAFEGSVSDDTKNYGRLRVMLANMNPDLAMDELLKKTGTGNIFVVFGEPDVEIKQAGEQLVVEIHGVDVYDPTTGDVRSGSTDDIACWFIDTDYNGESFFVRHAYFTGADEPYDKLKRALKAEVDEAAWSSLYSTVSYPFDRPETRKIAVKVINHYGDEVLKVYEVGG